jgi:hypothetical protein
MKFNFSRAQMIQAIVIIVAVLFVLSTVGVWYNPGTSGGSSTPQTGNTPEVTDENITVGMGNVVLIVQSYSPVIRLTNPNADAKAYLQQLQANGTVLYLDNSNPQYITVALSKGDDSPAVATGILNLDSNVTMLLEAYVYSDQAFEFTTESGTKVSATIPASKINVAKPYAKGELLYFNALVQLYNGTVIGAKLTPLAQAESAELPVLPVSFSPEHYARLYFAWHDRVGVDNSQAYLNETLKSLNVTGIRFQYTSDTTVYANKGLSKAEIDVIREKLPGLKVVQLNKIVFYDNYSYTEEQISQVVAEATNDTANVSFSPPMLEIGFSYSGNETQLTDAINSINYTPISEEIYRVCNASTGGLTVTIKGKQYRVRNMYVMALVPNTATLNNPEIAMFEVSIVGDEIVDAKPILLKKY